MAVDGATGVAALGRTSSRARCAAETSPQPPIKVLFVIGSLDVGGTERQLIALARGLNRKLFSPMVVCLSGHGILATELTQVGIRVQQLRLRGCRPWSHPIAFTRELVTLWRTVEAEQPDIIHGFLFHAYLMTAVLARLCRVPICVASRRSLGRFKQSHRIARLLERGLNHYTDLVVANSEAVRADAIRQERLSPKKIIVIYNGLAAGQLVSSPSPLLRQQLRLADGVAVVGVVANFIHYKGHEFFLEAWSTIVARVPHAVAILVGDGPTRESIERRAADMGVADSLRFAGTRRDVPDLLALMDVVVHPSQEEGFSNAILEAMAARKVVVATAVGGNPEAIRDGVTGVLVPPSDPAALATAVLQLLSDPVARARLGDAAHRRVVADFDIATMVRRYETAYARLLSRVVRGSESPVTES